MYQCCKFAYKKLESLFGCLLVTIADVCQAVRELLKKHMNPENIYRFQEKALFRSVGEEGVVLMLDSGQLFSCNETAEAFLRRLDGELSLAEIANAVCEEFEIDSKTLLEDLAELIKELTAENVLEKVG